MVDPDDYAYCVNIEYKGWGNHTMFQWTTELPTQEGWYWAVHQNNIVYMIRISPNDEKIITPYSDGYPVEMFHFTHWLGPLPIPEPPKGVTDARSTLSS